MKNSENPIIQNFLKQHGSLDCARSIADVCTKEPWRAKEFSPIINHAVRWAITKPNTFELISILLPHSDQAHDCRTLFKDACEHGRADVVRLLIDRVDGEVLRHNGGHAILAVAKNGNPEILQILKDKTEGVSLPIDVLFKKAIGTQGPALQSLDYLFPSVAKNIHHGLLYAAAGNNNLENLQFLLDKMSTIVKPSNQQGLTIKLKSAAQTAAAQGFEECLNLLIDTHYAWFNKDMDFRGLAAHALQHEQGPVLLTLAQRSEDVQKLVVRTAATSNNDCIQNVLAWMQHQNLTEETQHIPGTHKLRKL